jgi:AraC-like DNA-binding protein
MTASEKPRTPGKVIASTIRHILDLLTMAGLPVDEMKAEAGIRDEHLNDPTALIPITLMEDLLHAVMKRWDAPMLGLQTALPSAPEEFGVLGFIIQNCYTLTDIFDATMKYKELIGDLGLTSVHHEPGATVCNFDCTSLDPLLNQHCTEHIIGCWMGHTMLLNWEKNPVLEVRFRHDPPADPELLERYTEFFRCPVLFRQKRDSIVIASHAMNLPLRHPNAGLLETLHQHAREQLARSKSRNSLVEQARSRLRALMVQGSPSREALAESMGTSGRHLARLLEKEGSSYRDLLDELRLELAQNYLRDTTQTVEDVAQRLNFQESHSFIRWFRQLAGTTPGDYRQQYLRGVGGLQVGAG